MKKEFNIEVTHLISTKEVKDIYHQEAKEFAFKGIVKGISILDDNSYGYYTEKGYFKLKRENDRIFVSSKDKKANWLFREQKLKRLLNEDDKNI